MRLEIVRGFLSEDECSALNEWTMLAARNKWIDVGLSRGAATTTRLTSRAYGHRFVYPEIVREVDLRIRALLGIEDAPEVLGHGRSGIVVSCTFDGGDTYEHQDPRSVEGLATFRCNVLTQAPRAGGILHLEGEPVDLSVGDLHCYLASEHRHFVSPTVGDVPRILWMFGAHIPAEDWNSGKIQAKEFA